MKKGLSALLWITPLEFCSDRLRRNSRIKWQGVKRSKNSSTQGSLLRDKTGSRTVVVVGIVDPVGVELDIVVVELEVRGLREVAIGIGKFAFVRPCHQTSNLTSRWKRNYMFSILNLIWRHPVWEPILDKSKQYLLNATHSWKPWSPRLRLFLLTREFGAGNP